ncbi:NYN domain-containing protein [Lacisediminihabitans profunda]|uniref:NYN domain-containing protein n=1 Tax=Lacisediminihabitans profunda TaxID=2594790 RepID=A0A5C8UPP8_9MICO|nr:NYN domain-containing protein [Lacisediminihabitans profunda]TXN29314.1 NYN domain-containing protein [Lacisediminihabitans profunda]
MKTAHLFIDYQNLHLSAHDRFGTLGAAVHQSLIHPGLFATALEKRRNELVYEAVRIEKVHVFRGMPSNQNETVPASRNKAQKAEWTRDPRVVLYERPLRYPRAWPAEPAREKGVDVMLAITFIRAAMEKWADYLILASRDTDLLPALEIAHTIDGAHVEVAGWHGDSRLSFSGVKGGPRLWGTRLEEAEFKASKDPRRYA